MIHIRVGVSKISIVRVGVSKIKFKVGISVNVTV